MIEATRPGLTSDLTGAVVVVTGGATGIGRALALEASRRGASVMIGDVEDGTEAVASIEGAGGRALWQRCDVGDRADVVALRDASLAHFGHVNLVCSNVGIGTVGTLHSLSNDDFERTMRANVTGSFLILQTFTPDLLDAASLGWPAAIMFTGSEHSLGVPPTNDPPYVPVASDYTVSKHALLGIAAVARRDLLDEGVQVALLCPGWTATERLRAFAETDDHLRNVLVSMSQEPSEVAALAFDGLAQGQHIIATNPNSRDFVVATHAEIIEAVESSTKR